MPERERKSQPKNHGTKEELVVKDYPHFSDEQRAYLTTELRYAIFDLPNLPIEELVSTLPLSDSSKDYDKGQLSPRTEVAVNLVVPSDYSKAASSHDSEVTNLILMSGYPHIRDYRTIPQATLYKTMTEQAEFLKNYQSRLNKDFTYTKAGSSPSYSFRAEEFYRDQTEYGKSSETHFHVRIGTLAEYLALMQGRKHIIGVHSRFSSTRTATQTGDGEGLIVGLEVDGKVRIDKFPLEAKTIGVGVLPLIFPATSNQ